MNMRRAGVVAATLGLGLVGTGPSAAQQTQPRPGVAVQLADSVPRDEGIVRGRVLNAASGRPLAQATALLAPTFVGATTQSATTDARGRFELRGVAPGEYRVFAKAPGYVVPTDRAHDAGDYAKEVDVPGGRITDGLTIRLNPGAAISGRVFDTTGDGAPGVSVELLRARYQQGGERRLIPVASTRADDAGYFRVADLLPGRYYVKASMPTLPESDGDGTPVYVPTYFPQTAWLREARPLGIVAGQELFGIDFAMMVADTYAVTGDVVGVSEALLAEAEITLTPKAGNRGDARVARVSADGGFEMRNLFPGDYGLTVRRMRGYQAMASVDLTVDADIVDLLVLAKRGARVAGRIEPEGDEPRPTTWGSGIVMAVTHTGNGTTYISTTATLRPDGTFALDGVIGPATLYVRDLPSRWTVKAIELGNSDITDRPTDFNGATEPVHIVVTDRRTHLRGTVTDGKGRSVTDYTVVVFPADTERWTAYYRYVRGVQPRHDGTYRVEGLPPGDYLAIAVESILQHAWHDAKVLERLWSRATSFHLDEGERKTLDLRLERMPRDLIELQ